MPERRIDRLKGASCAAIAIALAACPVWAQTASPAVSVVSTRNSFGESGLLEMPDGRVGQDGALSITIGLVGEQQRYNLSYQLFPWLETTLRTSHVVGLRSDSSNRHLYEHSFGLKIRLAQETATAPEVSLGMRDALNTGLSGAEYISASKHFGALDVTLGTGWGTLSQSGTLHNPYAGLFHFKKRPDLQEPGAPSLARLFHGEKVGIFGGVKWDTPVKGLSVLAEYSSDRYQGYDHAGGVKVRAPVNVGLSYQPFDGASLSAGWFYGSTYGLTLTISGNTAQSTPSALRVGPPLPEAVVRNPKQQISALTILAKNKISGDRQSAVHLPDESEMAQTALRQDVFAGADGVRDVDFLRQALVVNAPMQGDRQAQCAAYAHLASANQDSFTTVVLSDLQSDTGQVEFCTIKPKMQLAALDGWRNVPASADPELLQKTIKTELHKQDLPLRALWVAQSELWITVENTRYDSASEAAGRVIRVLMSQAPASVEIFHLVFTVDGVPMQELTVVRSAMERALTGGTTSIEIRKLADLSAPQGGEQVSGEYRWNGYPAFSWSVGPKLAAYTLDPGKPVLFDLAASLGGKAVLAPGLTLTGEVTGDIWNNVDHAPAAAGTLPAVRSDVHHYLSKGYGIPRLQISYRSRLSDDIFAEIKGGYLEDMFMGGGGQILWAPDDSPLSFGVDAYQVWQRDYDRLFGARSYQTVTGHVSAYYRSPWYGVNFALHAGRYLAGDYGATFEIGRRFESGVEVSAWATITDAKKAQFGSGGFDRGFMIHIPLSWLLPIFSQSSGDMQMHSLVRNGGQRLVGDDALYADTRRTSADDIYDHIDDILAP